MPPAPGASAQMPQPSKSASDAGRPGNFKFDAPVAQHIWRYGLARFCRASQHYVQPNGSNTLLASLSTRSATRARVQEARSGPANLVNINNNRRTADGAGLTAAGGSRRRKFEITSEGNGLHHIQRQHGNAAAQPHSYGRKKPGLAQQPLQPSLSAP